MKRLLILLFVFILSAIARLAKLDADEPPTAAPASAADVAREVTAALDRLAKDNVWDDRGFKNADPEQVVAAAESHLSDASPQARSWSADLVANGLRRIADMAVRQVAVRLLVDVAVDDKDRGVRQRAAYKLLEAHGSDFDASAPAKALTLLKEADPPREFILLAGIVGAPDIKVRLTELAGAKAIDGVWWGQTRWLARLALARAGDKDSTKEYLEQVEAEKDQNLRITLLLKDVAYIRQPEAVALLSKYAMSDEELPTDDPRFRIRVAQRGLDALAHALADFPLREQPVDFSKEDIARARKWLEAHPHPKIIR